MKDKWAKLNPFAKRPKSWGGEGHKLGSGTAQVFCPHAPDDSPPPRDGGAFRLISWTPSAASLSGELLDLSTLCFVRQAPVDPQRRVHPAGSQAPQPAQRRPTPSAGPSSIPPGGKVMRSRRHSRFHSASPLSHSRSAGRPGAAASFACIPAGFPAFSASVWEQASQHIPNLRWSCGESRRF